MRLEDYLDATAFLEHGKPPRRERWVEDLKVAAGIRSFQGIG